jgi:hypothetical protein
MYLELMFTRVMAFYNRNLILVVGEVLVLEVTLSPFAIIHFIFFFS